MKNPDEAANATQQDSRGHGVQGDPATRLLGADHETAARTQLGSAACIPDAATVSPVAQAGETETFARPAHDAGRSTEQSPCVGETPASISPLDAGTISRHREEQIVKNVLNSLRPWLKHKSDCAIVVGRRTADEHKIGVWHYHDCDCGLHAAVINPQEQASSVADVSASVKSAGTEAGGFTRTEREGNESEVDYEGGTGAVANRKPSIEQPNEGAAQSASAPFTEDTTLPIILANSVMLLTRTMAHLGVNELECARQLSVDIRDHLDAINAYALAKDMSLEFAEALLALMGFWTKA